MITTALPVLQIVSHNLRETTTDTSSRRLSYFNSAMDHIIGKFKWSWARKKHVLDVSADVQIYDLLTEIYDYNILLGLYEIYIDGKKITVGAFENTDQAATDGNSIFSLSPDNKTLEFTTTLSGAEVIEIWYYATHIKVTADDTVLNISLPNEIGDLVGHYARFLDHNSKRQRNDARNAMIDFTDLLDDLRPMDMSNKSRDGKKTMPPLMKYFGFKRRYAN